jgi:hypothetical protein
MRSGRGSTSLGPIETALLALNDAGVRYLVVGGVAVVLHGRLRTTTDLDLWLDPDPGNLERATKALAALNSPLKVRTSVREPLDFEAAQARGVVVSLGSTEARIAGLEDLLEMKRGSGRAQDGEDVLALEALRERKYPVNPLQEETGEFPDRTWEAHRRRQATNGLRLTPAERLRWLEDTMEEMRRWVGRAKDRRPIRGEPGGSSAE